MGGRGASGSAKNYKVPTSYRGPGEFGEAFAKLNPKLTPKQVADRAVTEWFYAEDNMVSDFDADGVYGAAFEYAAKKRGMTDAEIQRQIRSNLKKPLSVEIPF